MINLLAEPKNRDFYPPIDLSEILLPANSDYVVIVKMFEDSADFNKGDLLVVDRSKEPKLGDWALYYERENWIERYCPGDLYVRGTVTSIIRQL